MSSMKRLYRRSKMNFKKLMKKNNNSFKIKLMMKDYNGEILIWHNSNHRSKIIQAWENQIRVYRQVRENQIRTPLVKAEWHHL